MGCCGFYIRKHFSQLGLYGTNWTFSLLSLEILHDKNVQKSFIFYMTHWNRFISVCHRLWAAVIQFVLLSQMNGELKWLMNPHFLRKSNTSILFFYFGLIGKLYCDILPFWYEHFWGMICIYLIWDHGLLEIW